MWVLRRIALRKSGPIGSTEKGTANARQEAHLQVTLVVKEGKIGDIGKK
jgi:hypothetical protein